MNTLDKQYTDLLQDILDNGTRKMDRTGTGTISVFGRQIRHKMSEGFPLLTTKKMPFKTIVTELLWFLRGDTNIKYLVDNGCNIWVGDSFSNYIKEMDKQFPHILCFDKEKFINKIKTDTEFAKKWGDLGPVYGKQWRHWETDEEYFEIEGDDIPENIREKYSKVKYTRPKQIDQIANLINDLKNNPDSRRLMVNAWNVGELDQMVLPPCHYGFQVYTRELSEQERWLLYIETCNKLKTPSIKGSTNKETMESYYQEYNIPTRAISLLWNQRSVDTFLGLPFNIASYGLLLEIIATATNMVPDELVGNLGDTHLYLNHIEQAKEQIGRKLTLDERRASVTQEMFNQIYNAGDSSTLTHSEIDQWNIPSRTREPLPLPTLVINDEFWNKDAGLLSNLPHIQVSDFYVDNYQSHQTIKAPLSN
jgi:thymidylate synthase